MRAKCYDDYQQERKRLQPKEIEKILQAGRAWNLAPLLQQGGAVIFPHTFLRSCGGQIAAAVHAALDSGADQVIALGVLHTSTDLQRKARIQEREKKTVLRECPRGIFGPDLPHSEQIEFEYSLLSFEFLWHEEIKRRGIRKPPTLYFRYPFITNRHPSSMPRIQELKALAKDAVIVGTCDFCHHGVAYGMAKEKVFKPGEGAEQYAWTSVTENVQTLAQESYEAFYRHCGKVKSDAFDVGIVLKYLRKPFRPELLDLVIIDTSSLYEHSPQPSWVAGSLVTFSHAA